jgi:hypothetical protein
LQIGNISSISDKLENLNSHFLNISEVSKEMRLVNKCLESFVEEIDRECKSIDTNFQATQKDNPIRQGIALLKLDIIGNGNNMGPSFAQPRYHAVVSENEAVGTTVITVTVNDHNKVGDKTFQTI